MSNNTPHNHAHEDEFDLSIDATIDLGLDGETLNDSTGSTASPLVLRSGEEPTRDRIVVLGRTRAGKTIYLSRLYEQCWHGNGPLHMETSSEPAAVRGSRMDTYFSPAAHGARII